MKTMAIYQRPEPEVRVREFARTTAILGSVVSVVALVSSTDAIEIQWPPTDRSEWHVTEGLAIAAVCLSLFASRTAKTRLTRWIANAAIPVAALACFFPVTCYYGSFHEMPWPAIYVMAALTIIGGFFCRQRLTSAAMAALLLLWLGPAALPPFEGTHRLAAKAGLTVSFDQNKSEGLTNYSIVVQGGRNEDLARRYDLAGIQVKGSIGALIDVQCWSPSQFSLPEVDKPRLDRVTLEYRSSVPGFARSWNAEVVVPIWPEHPSGPHVVIDLDSAGKPVKGSLLRASTATRSLIVSDVRWTKSTHQWPEEQCLALTVRYDGPDNDGWNGSELKVSDRSGRAMTYGCSGSEGSDHGTTAKLEISGLSKVPKSIRVDYFSKAERQRNRLVFHFPRLAEPAALNP